MADGLITEVSEGVARIVVDRPEARNALSADIVQGMADFVESIEHDPAVRVILVRGAGDHFMAGGDVKSFAQVMDKPVEEIRASFETRSANAARLWIALERIPQPVVCMVRGFAAGASLSFVAGADFTIASDGAMFILAHVGIGLVADAATTYHLPRAVGLRKAKEIALFGDRLNAQQALDIGLVNKVVPDADLEGETEAVLQRLAKGPAVSLAQAKWLMNASLGSDLAGQIERETAAVGICGASNDLKEGVRAFVEKRRPAFRGN